MFFSALSSNLLPVPFLKRNFRDRSSATAKLGFLQCSEMISDLNCWGSGSWKNLEFAVMAAFCSYLCIGQAGQQDSAENSGHKGAAEKKNCTGNCSQIMTLIPESVETHLRCRKESSNSLSESSVSPKVTHKLCLLRVRNFSFSPDFQVRLHSGKSRNQWQHLLPHDARIQWAGTERTERNCENQGKHPGLGKLHICSFSLRFSAGLTYAHATQCRISASSNCSGWWHQYKRLQLSDPSQLLFLKILKAILFVISFPKI